MRRLLPVLIGVATAACVGATRLDPSARTPRGGNRGAPLEAIVVGEQSNVCVSVRVDQRVWPRPLDADSARNFSGHLMSELRRIYVLRGGSGSLPGTQNEARFVADANGTNPNCRHRDTDVFVDLRYGPRPDGSPFVMEYRVRHGTLVRAGAVERDVAEEVRTGRIPGFHTRRTIETVIVQDMCARAPVIVDQMLVGDR